MLFRGKHLSVQPAADSREDNDGSWDLAHMYDTAYFLSRWTSSRNDMVATSDLGAHDASKMS